MSEGTIWRSLEIGEQVLQGDQCWADGSWHSREPQQGETLSKDQAAHRRRITIPVVGWPPPRYDDPAKCGDLERMILEWSHGLGGGSYWGCRANGWTPCRAWLEQPPGPVAQKSEAEAAWDRVALLPTTTKDWSNRDFFLFGFEQGKDK